MTRRFQFSVGSLLIATFGAACFFGGMSLQRQLDRPVPVSRVRTERRNSKGTQVGWKETIRLPDGTEWERLNVDDGPSVFAPVEELVNRWGVDTERLKRLKAEAEEPDPAPPAPVD